MLTLLNEEIPAATEGLVYLCQYNYETSTLHPKRTLFFANAWEALEAYANIPNAESQLAMKTKNASFEDELAVLHSKMLSRRWQEALAETL